MKLKLEWSERWIMLMACGSPGSALAFHRLGGGPESKMVRRTMAQEMVAPMAIGGGE